MKNDDLETLNSMVLDEKNARPELVARRKIAAALGSFSLLALAGCAAPAESERDGESSTGQVAQPLLTGISSVASVNELRTTSLAANQLLHLEGYYSPGDGGEGFFWCNTSDTTSPDDSGTIFVDAAGHRWYREKNGQPYSVKWFGAYGNGTNASLTRAAIQKAIDVAAADYFQSVVWLPPGQYLVDSTIRVTAPQTIGLIGAGNHTINGSTRIVPTALSFDVILASDVQNGLTLRGFDIGPLVTPGGAGGAAIHILRGGKIEIDNIAIYDVYNGILVDSAGDVHVRQVEIVLADVAPPAAPAYRFGAKFTGDSYAVNGTGNPNYAECLSVQISMQNGEAAANVRTPHGFVQTNGYFSLTLAKCGVLSCDISRWITADSGRPAPDNWVEEGGSSDHCNVGWQFDVGRANGNNQIENSFCTSSVKENFFASAGFVADIQFSNCRAINTGSTTSGSGAGYHLGGPGRYALTGCVAEGTGGNGVHVGGGARANISGGNFSNAGNGGGASKEAIVFFNAAESSVTGATVSGSVSATAGLGAIGIYLSKRIVISGNVIEVGSTNSHGVIVQGCSDISISGNVVPGIGSTVYSGVYLYGSNFCVVTGNRIMTFAYGVLEQAGDHNLVSSNNLAYNGTGLFMSGASSMPAAGQAASVALNIV